MRSSSGMSVGTTLLTSSAPTRKTSVSSSWKTRKGPSRVILPDPGEGLSRAILERDLVRLCFHTAPSCAARPRPAGRTCVPHDSGRAGPAAGRVAVTPAITPSSHGRAPECVLGPAINPVRGMLAPTWRRQPTRAPGYYAAPGRAGRRAISCRCRKPAEATHTIIGIWPGDEGQQSDKSA